MVEKAKFEKKEMAKHVFRCICIVMLGLLFGMGYLFMLVFASYEIQRYEIFYGIPSFVFYGLTMAVWIVIVEMCQRLSASSKEAMKKNIKKFQLDQQIDEFLRYLDTHEEIPVRFKVGLECFPEAFRSLVKIRKRSFLVRKEAPNVLAVKVLKRKKVIVIWNFKEYDYFFKYFEPIYSEM